MPGPAEYVVVGPRRWPGMAIVGSVVAIGVVVEMKRKRKKGLKKKWSGTEETLPEL